METVGFLVHNKSFCELYAEAYNLGTDGLADLRKSVSAAWVKNLGADAALATHGHHIVHKLGANTLSPVGKADNAASQLMLFNLGINLLENETVTKQAIDNGETLYNLCIAPFKYVHSDRYVHEVRRLLETATTKRQAEIILTDIAIALHEGKYIDSLFGKFGVV